MAFDKQAASFSDIMRSIRTRLIGYSTLSDTYVRVVASDHYEIYCHDAKFIYIRYHQPVFDTDASVGKRARRCTRLFRVYMYIRDSLDEIGGDEVALLSQLGLSDMEELVVSALDDFTPFSGTRKLTIEPLHILNEGGPAERKPEDDIGLIRSSLLFQVVYIPTIDPPDQYGT